MVSIYELGSRIKGTEKPAFKTPADRLRERISSLKKSKNNLEEQKLAEATVDDPLYSFGDRQILERDLYEELISNGFSTTKFSWNFRDVIVGNDKSVTYTAIHEDTESRRSVFVLQHTFDSLGERAKTEILIKTRTLDDDRLLAHPTKSLFDAELSEPITLFERGI